PDQAFSLKVSRETNGGLAFRWTIAAGHYLYRDHTVATAPGGEESLSLQLQPGENKYDPGFGVVDIWRSAGRARLAAATVGRAGLDQHHLSGVQGRLDLLSADHADRYGSRPAARGKTGRGRRGPAPCRTGRRTGPEGAACARGPACPCRLAGFRARSIPCR